MSLISFKHVGIKNFEVNKTSNVEKTNFPIGIKTPMEFGNETFLKMNNDIGVQLADNLRNLILTNWGDRVAIYRYGANLQELVTEFSNQENFDSEAMLRINTAVSQWMPFVTLVGFSSQPIYENNRYTGIVKITIEYSVPQIQIFNKQIHVTLYVI